MKHVPSAITFKKVSKRFAKQDAQTLKDLFPALLGRLPKSGNFWALRDISLDIPRGATIGVVGRNGSGKSTLLKLIAGVTQPTKGTVEVKGRVVPLIELGAGFHHELSGRENIYLNGVILGLSRKKIDQQFDSIVEYAGLQDFIDTPVKHYSSGMYMRLAFAIAVHSEPEILLVDEILAVGDISFQEKCLASIQQFARQKETTIFMVAHSSELIEKFCTEVVWLDQGRIVMKGDPKRIVPEYLEASVKAKSISVAAENAPSDLAERQPDQPLKIVAAELASTTDQTKVVFRDEPIVLRLELEAARDVSGFSVGFIIHTLAGEAVWERNSMHEGLKFVGAKAGQKFEITIEMPAFLNSGTYTVTLAVASSQGVMWQWLNKYLTFKVIRKNRLTSVINAPVTFTDCR